MGNPMSQTPSHHLFHGCYKPYPNGRLRLIPHADRHAMDMILVSIQSGQLATPYNSSGYKALLGGSS